MFHGQHDLINHATASRLRAAGINAAFGRAMRQANINSARQYLAMARWYRQRRELCAQADAWRAAALVAHRAGETILCSTLHAKADRIEDQAYRLPHPLA